MFTHDKATIAVGESLSTPVDIAKATYIGIICPAAMEGTTLTFQVGITERGDFHNLFNDSGSEVTATVAAGRAVGVDGVLAEIAAWGFLKIRTGTASSPTVQAGAAADLILALKS